ncbi:MAG: hypothetical protein WDM85_01280 [Caulobacteraceae bacterium]
MSGDTIRAGPSRADKVLDALRELEGVRCYTSVVAAKAGLDQRHAAQVLRELVNLGLVQCAKGKRPSDQNRWRLAPLQPVFRSAVPTGDLA